MSEPAPYFPPLLSFEELQSLAPQIPQPVALTGATGFVGGHLLQALLAAGVRLRLLLRQPGKLPGQLRQKVEVVEGDLASGEALAQLVQGCGTLLHVAGLVRAGAAQDFFTTNALGTQRLVEQASLHGQPRLVYVSSLAAAGPSREVAGKAPEDPPEPISAYGRSKLAGEEAVKKYQGPWVILRPPAIYGPCDRDVFVFFKLASKGWVPYPAGERYLTVAFVGDVVQACLHAAALGLSQKVLHLGEPQPYAMRQLLQTLVEAGGLRARLCPLPGWVFRAAGRLGDALHSLGFRQMAMTSDKARELLACHWTAQTQTSLQALGLPPPLPFAQGAKLTWDWYRQAGWLPHARM
jgi:nucleoside-diphosphate-sugar epimerase